MTFPLGQWIDDHETLPHQLGASGMRGSLRTTLRVLRGRRTNPPELGLLQRTVAARLGVDEGSVFLTHGASEGNAFVMFFLSQAFRKELGRAPTVRYRTPEYPPLTDVAGLAGFQPGTRGRRPELFIGSNPQNPTGILSSWAELEAASDRSPAVLLDETFREFSPAPSLARARLPRLWVTGTMTKAFGADSVRVGWVVPPDSEVARFRPFYDLVTDEIPDESIRIALDLFEESAAILGEARGILQKNRSVLRRALPKLPAVRAPVCFDRPGLPSTDELAERALGRGVLVCPGRFFGDPSGVRLGLTRRNFPAALSAYLAVRAEVPDRHARRPRAS